MSRSLTLSAYLAMRRGAGGASGPDAAPPLRPGGPLVWVHQPDAGRIGAIAALAEALDSAGEGPALLVTLPAGDALPPAPPGVIVQAGPPEQAQPVRAFLDHWRPDLLLWLGGALRPVLLAATDQGGLPRLMADAGLAPLMADGARWMPGLSRPLLMRFDHVAAVDADAALRLHRAGLPQDRIEVLGPLAAMPVVLPCNERDRRDMTQIIGPRPSWLVADAVAEELPAIITAHRLASGRAHRLLLILVPRDPGDGPAMAAGLRAAGLVAACRSDGADPGPAIEAYLADQSGEMGLWYRLSPLSFLGGTLAGPGGRHPFEAAALGSAVLHGRHVAPHQDAYQRLGSVRAARAVASGSDLGQAVEMLLQPDRAAAMAHAAWNAITAGADVGNRLAALICAHLARPRPGPAMPELR